MEKMTVNQADFEVIRLLGKGKGGYSYLVADANSQYVLKQIHHEPCEYYRFGDKLQSEMRDYQRLKNIGIRLPNLIDVDNAQERILKEFIDGETIMSLVIDGKMKEDYFEQMREMCRLLYAAKTNIDYFPTNFVVQRDEIYYIDYECNDYMEEWNFEKWGCKYWSHTPELLAYLKEHPIK